MSEGGPLVIIWHSRTGAARAMAAAAAQGATAAARDDGGAAAPHDGGSAVTARVCLICAEDVTPGLLLQAAGYLFVCPENLGTMSGIMKDMFDRNYYPLLGRVAGRAYATMIAAGSDGRGAQAQIDRIVTGWRLRRVANPLIVNVEAQSPEAILAPKTIAADILEKCHELGFAMMAGMMLGIF